MAKYNLAFFLDMTYAKFTDRRISLCRKLEGILKNKKQYKNLSPQEKMLEDYFNEMESSAKIGMDEFFDCYANCKQRLQSSDGISREKKDEMQRTLFEKSAEIFFEDCCALVSGEDFFREHNILGKIEEKNNSKEERPMSNLIPPKIGDNVKFTCPNCGEVFTHKKQLVPLPVKCPKCGKGNCHEDKRIHW